MVRLTEFWRRMDEVLGPQAQTFARDQVLTGLGDRTVAEALAQGEAAKDVWRVVHETLDLPPRLR